MVIANWNLHDHNEIYITKVIIDQTYVYFFQMKTSSVVAFVQFFFFFLSENLVQIILLNKRLI